ncbi:MAG: FtsX-like permease family protein [Clostridia bacterium]|nr:FtsX-like permease family protein [Clostridia bacterium]
MYGLIAFVSSINIYNIISSSIVIRKREFAIFSSIGMNKKQQKKMLRLEAIFYGIDSCIYGIIISLVILYLMYISLVETRLYLFKIPLKSILFCIVVTYALIYISIKIGKRKLSNKNIIDEIKNENI